MEMRPTERPIEPHSTTKQPPLEFGILLICLFLSGFAALVYELVWFRQFATVFGTSELAIGAVLASYMGGMALGARFAGRIIERVDRPLLLYAMLEIGIAASALLVPLALSALRFLFVAVTGGQSELPDASGFLLPFLSFAGAFIVTAAPTMMLGATLPFVTAHAVRRRDQIGSRFGLIYALNTAGAVGGVIVAAILLLPAMGLTQATLCAAAANVVAALLAMFLARRITADPTAVDVAPLPASNLLSLATSRARQASAVLESAGTIDLVPRRAWILPLVAASGFAAFASEVLWTRLLSHVLGGSLNSFATMLASFLVGIALGSAIASRWASAGKRAATGWVFAQAFAALATLVAFNGIERFGDGSFGAERGGFGTNIMIAIAALGPVAIGLGAAFPCAVRILAQNEMEAGAAAARVAGWNTVGAIAGALGASLVLLPLWDFHGTAALVSGLSLLLAIIVWGAMSDRPLVPLYAIAMAGLALAIAPPKSAESFLRHSPLPQLANEGEIIYRATGKSATVLLMAQQGTFSLRTNGLPEATILPAGAPPIDAEKSQRWLTALPILARPASKSVLLVGLGGGVAAERLPKSIESVDVVEIEPLVIEANRMIAERRLFDPLSDARIRVVCNDGRSALELTKKRFDVIVSQPSHPWTSGASHLYTREYFALARGRLSDDGVFVQWASAAFVDDSLLRSVGATLLDVFEHVRLYQPSENMLLFLASDAPLEVERDLAKSGGPLDAEPGPFNWLGVHGVDDLAAILALDGTGLRDYCSGAAIITDNRNRLATQTTGRVVALERRPDLEALHPLIRPGGWTQNHPGFAIDRSYAAQRLAAAGMQSKAMAIARTIADESERELALALCQSSGSLDPTAEPAIENALRLNPNDQDAAFLTIEPALSRLAVGSADGATYALAQRIGEPGASVIEGWRCLGRGSWLALSKLDERLAKARPTDACHPLAVYLRAMWRANLPRPDRADLAKEGLDLIDGALALYPGPSLWQARLDVAASANQPDAVVETAAALFEKINGLGQPLLQAPAGREFLAGTAKTARKRLAPIAAQRGELARRATVVDRYWEALEAAAQAAAVAAREASVK